MGNQHLNKSTAESGDGSAGPAPAGVDPNADVADLKASMQDLRSDLQGWGAAVGLIATTVLTGVSWTQLNKLFPLPTEIWWVAPVAVASALGAVGGSAFILLRLYRAQRRILIGTACPPPKRSGLTWLERKKVEKILDEQARVEEAIHIQDLDARATRIDRIATRLERSKSDLAVAARAESNRLNHFVGLALRRAALALLENRTRKAISGIGTWVALLAAAFGIAGVFTVANYSQGKQQKGPADKALACLRSVDAGAVIATWELVTLQESCAKLVTP